MRIIATLIVFALAFVSMNAQDQSITPVDTLATDSMQVEKAGTPSFNFVSRSDISTAEKKVEISGEFDLPFAHPECNLDDPVERKDCSTQQLIKDIRKNLTYDPSKGGKPVESDKAVDIRFSVNQFGNIKSIRVVYTGDKQISQSIIQALYSVPKMLPARKGGSAVPCAVDMSIPYESIFGPTQ